MIELIIDGRQVQVPKGTTVYQAAKALGADIPIFCYQDRMPPFGACRVCLVEVEKMPKLQTSCTLEATAGMVVKTASTLAQDGRKHILELLLINHPLDCPICDKGGECPLQDQTLHHGPQKSRFYEEKRHFVKPYALSSVLMLDRERCIVCARCTRFGDIIAGDHALEFIDRGFKTEVGVPGGGPCMSKFIGNTIEICPVGALTSQVYRFRARPWDNEVHETSCTLCPVGCSMIFDTRDGKVMRTRSKENKDVNDIWMCDKGWFGYEFEDHPQRLKVPLIRKDNVLVEASWDEAFTFIADKVQVYAPAKKIAGIGGNALTTEECYLFQKLMRDVLGTPHVDHRVGACISMPEDNTYIGMDLSICDIEHLDAAFLFGLDITEEFPVLWLRLKQAINRGAHVCAAGHYPLEIAPHLAQSIVHAPLQECAIFEEQLSRVSRLAHDGKKVALFIGRQYIDSKNRSEILSRLAHAKKEMPALSINVMTASENSLGARFAGMHPEFLPMGRRSAVVGKSCGEVFQEAMQHGWDMLYVAGANPAGIYPKEQWEQVRKGTSFLVVHDLFLTETAACADVVLPCVSYVEKEGSFINIEKRVQQVHPAKLVESLFSDGALFTEIAARLGRDIATMDSVFASQLTKEKVTFETQDEKKPASTQHQTPTGSLLATFSSHLFDQGVRMRHNSHLSGQTIEPKVRMHPRDALARGVHVGGRALIRINETAITLNASFDSAIPESVVVLPRGFAPIGPYEYGTSVEVERDT